MSRQRRLISPKKKLSGEPGPEELPFRQKNAPADRGVRGAESSRLLHHFAEGRVEGPAAFRIFFGPGEERFGVLGIGLEQLFVAVLAEDELLIAGGGVLGLPDEGLLGVFGIALFLSKDFPDRLFSSVTAKRKPKFAVNLKASLRNDMKLIVKLNMWNLTRPIRLVKRKR